ncbi:MAG: hypothetical protein R3F59_18560 [Myxococcota bacterium]
MGVLVEVVEPVALGPARQRPVRGLVGEAVAQVLVDQPLGRAHAGVVAVVGHDEVGAAIPGEVEGGDGVVAGGAADVGVFGQVVEPVGAEWVGQRPVDGGRREAAARVRVHAPGGRPDAGRVAGVGLDEVGQAVAGEVERGDGVVVLGAADVGVLVEIVEPVGAERGGERPLEGVLGEARGRAGGRVAVVVDAVQRDLAVVGVHVGVVVVAVVGGGEAVAVEVVVGRVGTAVVVDAVVGLLGGVGVDVGVAVVAVDGADVAVAVVVGVRVARGGQPRVAAAAGQQRHDHPRLRPRPPHRPHRSLPLQRAG